MYENAGNLFKHPQLKDRRRYISGDKFSECCKILSRSIPNCRTSISTAYLESFNIITRIFPLLKTLVWTGSSYIRLANQSNHSQASVVPINSSKRRHTRSSFLYSSAESLQLELYEKTRSPSCCQRGYPGGLEMASSLAKNPGPGGNSDWVEKQAVRERSVSDYRTTQHSNDSIPFGLSNFCCGHLAFLVAHYFRVRDRVVKYPDDLIVKEGCWGIL